MKFGNQKGFTLIEVMIVVVILGTLAGLVIPKIMDRPDEAKQTKAKMQIQGLVEALSLFKIDNGNYPSSEQGLKALVEKPEIGKIPAKYRTDGYMSAIPSDPWGNNYQYLSPGRHGEFDLYSRGADGEVGGDGKGSDIESWTIQ